jgi:hypothetical protein
VIRPGRLGLAGGDPDRVKSDPGRRAGDAVELDAVAVRLEQRLGDHRGEGLRGVLLGEGDADGTDPAV